MKYGTIFNRTIFTLIGIIGSIFLFGIFYGTAYNNTNIFRIFYSGLSVLSDGNWGIILAWIPLLIITIIFYFIGRQIDKKIKKK